MFCKRCGAGLRENDKFCSQCGAPAAEMPEDYPVNLKEEDEIPARTRRDRKEIPENRASEMRSVYNENGDSSQGGLERGYGSKEQPGGYGASGQPGPYDGYQNEEQPGRYGASEQAVNYDGYGREGQQDDYGEYRRDGFYGSVRRDSGKTYSDEKRYREENSKYRDSFLDKKEEKSHAILVTVAVLLIIVVLAMAFLVLFFFMKKNAAGINQGNEIQILSDGNQSQSLNGDGGSGDGIVLLTEAGGQEQDAGASQGNGPQTGSNTGNAGDQGQNSGAVAGETTAAAQAEASQSGQAEPTTEASQSGQAEPATEAPQTEPVTEAPTEAEVSAIDAKRINEIWNQDSTATRAQVYVYDLNHQKEYATEGAGEAMYASALISVPILYTAAVKLDQKEITLNDTIPYVNSIGGRGEAYPEQKEGQSFPLSYYLTTMMSYSDNNCMNCLIDFFGLETINSTCQGAGFSSVDIQRKIVAEVTDGRDNYVSARDLAGMLKDLYWGKYQTLGSEFVKTYFKIDAGDGYRTVIGLADLLPSGIVFLNQNGKGDTRYNEVALIADDTHQYIISIMCNGDYGFQYETAVENISNYVYQSLT